MQQQPTTTRNGAVGHAEREEGKLSETENKGGNGNLRSQDASLGRETDFLAETYHLLSKKQKKTTK